MIHTNGEAPSFHIGEIVVGMILRFEAESASYFLQLRGNVPAVISTYEISADDLDTLKPGSTLEAVVDRIERNAGHITVVLRKHAQPIAI